MLERFVFIIYIDSAATVEYAVRGAYRYAFLFGVCVFRIFILAFSAHSYPSYTDYWFRVLRIDYIFKRYPSGNALRCTKIPKMYASFNINLSMNAE